MYPWGTFFLLSLTYPLVWSIFCRSKVFTSPGTFRYAKFHYILLEHMSPEICDRNTKQGLFFTACENVKLLGC